VVGKGGHDLFYNVMFNTDLASVGERLKCLSEKQQQKQKKNKSAHICSF
jgi:hypothetical protein